MMLLWTEFNGWYVRQGTTFGSKPIYLSIEGNKRALWSNTWVFIDEFGNTMTALDSSPAHFPQSRSQDDHTLGLESKDFKG